MTAILDGQPLDAATAWERLSPALRVGDGVFRTIRVHAGRALWLDDHVAALLRAVDAAAYDRAGLSIRLERTLAAVMAVLPEQGVLRLFASPRADNFDRALLTPLSVWALVDERLPVPTPDGYAQGVHVGDSEVPHPGSGAWGKTCGTAWARTAMRLAYREQLDDVLVARGDGLLESARASIVWREGQHWYRVPRESGAWPRVARLRFDEAVGGLQESELTRARAVAADQLVLCSSLRLLIGVRAYRERRWERPDEGLDAIRSAWLEAAA